MAEVLVCSATPIPSFQSLYDQVVPIINIPSLEVLIPEMPSIPSPIWPGIKKFSIQTVITMSELQIQQMQQTFFQFIEPLTSFLGLDIGSILPSMPVIPDFNLIDFLEGNVDEMLIAVKQAIADFDPGLSSIIPIPLYFNANSLAEEALITLQAIVRDYQNSLLSFVEGLISQVTGILEIAGMPSLPTVPSSAEMLDIFLSMLPSLVPGLDDLLALTDQVYALTGKLIADGRDAIGSIPNLLAEFNFLSGRPDVVFPRLGIEDAAQWIKDAAMASVKSITTLLDSIVVPSVSELIASIVPAPFPAFVSPDLSGIINSFEQDFQEVWKNMIADMQQLPMNMVLDFCNGPLSLLGFSFPTVCVPIFVVV